MLGRLRSRATCPSSLSRHQSAWPWDGWRVRGSRARNSRPGRRRSCGRGRRCRWCGGEIPGTLALQPVAVTGAYKQRRTAISGPCVPTGLEAHPGGDTGGRGRWRAHSHCAGEWPCGVGDAGRTKRGRRGVRRSTPGPPTRGRPTRGSARKRPPIALPENEARHSATGGSECPRGVRPARCRHRPMRSDQCLGQCRVGPGAVARELVEEVGFSGGEVGGGAGEVGAAAVEGEGGGEGGVFGDGAGGGGALGAAGDVAGQRAGLEGGEGGRFGGGEPAGGGVGGEVAAQGEEFLSAGPYGQPGHGDEHGDHEQAVDREEAEVAEGRGAVPDGVQQYGGEQAEYGQRGPGGAAAGIADGGYAEGQAGQGREERMRERGHDDADEEGARGGESRPEWPRDWSWPKALPR